MVTSSSSSSSAQRQSPEEEAASEVPPPRSRPQSIATRQQREALDDLGHEWAEWARMGPLGPAWAPHGRTARLLGRRRIMGRRIMGHGPAAWMGLHPACRMCKGRGQGLY